MSEPVYTYYYEDTPFGRCLYRATDGGPPNVSFPVDSRNADYRNYLAWVDDGNTPEAA